ncbi:hypothetical protein AU189_07540 [Mycolicibacterium acapulense]|nr:hypothetical protein AU189_07540 [Mycolicibacterium acapulense]KUI18078.1 hypothetical protein AU191_02080 [Mycolicibacterium acapulense]
MVRDVRPWVDGAVHGSRQRLEELSGVGEEREPHPPHGRSRPLRWLLTKLADATGLVVASPLTGITSAA